MKNVVKIVRSYKLDVQEKNLNQKFRNCKRCGAFEQDDDQKSDESNDFKGMEDRKMNESKIDILLREVRKLGH